MDFWQVSEKSLWMQHHSALDSHITAASQQHLHKSHLFTVYFICIATESEFSAHSTESRHGVECGWSLILKSFTSLHVNFNAILKVKPMAALWISCKTSRVMWFKFKTSSVSFITSCFYMTLFSWELIYLAELCWKVAVFDWIYMRLKGRKSLLHLCWMLLLHPSWCGIRHAAVGWYLQHVCPHLESAGLWIAA